MISPTIGTGSPIWRHRAASIGFYILDGKDVASMEEKDIAAAFDKLSLRYGISYIWRDRG